MLSFDANSNIDHVLQAGSNKNIGDKGENQTPENLNLNSLNPAPQQQAQPYFRNNFTDMQAGFMSGWQDDGLGNMVGVEGDRLVTRNERGQIVDYDQYVEGKRASTHQDLALTSMMMLNPFMVFGLGAGMSFMSDQYMNSRQRRLAMLNRKLRGGSRNFSVQDDGDEDTMRANERMNNAINGRYMSTIESYHHVNSFSRPQDNLKKKPKMSQSFDSVGDRLRVQAAATARKSMNMQKLLKEKFKLQDNIERMRGKASLEEMSRWYSQLEVLDRAIKQIQAFQ